MYNSERPSAERRLHYLRGIGVVECRKDSSPVPVNFIFEFNF